MTLTLSEDIRKAWAAAARYGPLAFRDCAVEGCDERVKSRGYCSSHYHRRLRHGDPLGGRPPDGTLERYQHLIEFTETCWLWKGSRTRYGEGEGYGRVSVAHRMTLAHRAVYEAVVGPIPDGLHLDHLCRVRLCVNPAHLEPVTPTENRRRR